MEDFKKLFDSFARLKVGVIGDVMLDTYMWGSVERISPEAPVPVVSLHKKDYRIGGAGNVALNIQSLGASAFVLSVIGKDEDGDRLERLFAEKNIHTTYLVRSGERITTNKTRIISRNQQMMRLDAEITRDLNGVDATSLIDRVKVFIAKERPDVIVFEDYNKGVLTEGIIHEIISICKKAGILTAADPKRKNFFSYKWVDIFKPNLKEVKEGLNLLLEEVNRNTLGSIHKELAALLHHAISLITLSDKGIFYQKDGQAEIIASHLRNVADVSGAGDTVIAVASLVYVVTKNVRMMAEIANIAGGLVCEEVGTVAINKEKLLQECELLLP
ncbi:MAG: bifunctional ADP-heptose synthase [Bacteroidota bacterium]|nr:bifunctional ADP-heptose synthase [Bacteroidota bacterium]